MVLDGEVIIFLKTALCVYLEDLKASNIQDANERGSLSLGLVECFVDPHDEPAEHPLICGLSEGFHGKLCLFLSLSLLDIVSTHLDSG